MYTLTDQYVGDMTVESRKPILSPCKVLLGLLATALLIVWSSIHKDQFFANTFVLELIPDSTVSGDITVSENTTVSGIRPTSGTRSASKIKIIDYTGAAIASKVCSTGRVAGMKFPLCVYTAAEDPVVSETIISTGYWDPGFVTELLEICRADNATVFIDIGANVGAYSLAAAHAGYRVISVEPNSRTMRHLATSVDRGHLSDRMTLLQNGVSNEHSSVHVGVMASNRGVSYLLPANYCVQYPNNSWCRETAVDTITLDDLLEVLPPLPVPGRKLPVVMKIDAEGCEIKIFDPETSRKFFTSVNAFAVQIEWVWINRKKAKDTPESINNVVKYIRQLNYTIYAANKQRALLGQDWIKWPDDILLLKH